MTHEPSPPSLNLSRCKINREYVALAYEILKSENDARQKSIADGMIDTTRHEISKILNRLQRMLLEELLEDVAIMAGWSLCDKYEAATPSRPGVKPTGVSSQIYQRELDRQKSINNAVETFGRNINSYNPVFTEYLDNYALYSPHYDTVTSMDEILTIVYGPNARETHLHPKSPSDIGCPACTCQTLMQAFKLKDTAKRKSLLSHKEQKRNQWLLSNIADL